ncbi:hypothetical protein BCR44DRAFT_43309 [Catenaria anguillulae PL171]|uniref:ATP-grasp domain-containing protein n=1 Tax=Catenaria anguillulae PL171 TaxID=765915 RepID=A0A1Y2H8E8_9FUNG|nr:hypothetical protein BCR44DRAFT_43309 [Catenaria anguillulae PL171]
MLNPQSLRTSSTPAAAASATKSDSSAPAGKKTSRGSRSTAAAANNNSNLSGNSPINAQSAAPKHLRASAATNTVMTYAQAIMAGANAATSSSSSPATTAATGTTSRSSPTPDAQPASGQRICKGRVANLESNVPPAWWTHIFDQVYLKTDGDVVEDPEVTRSEVDLLESYPYLANVFRRGMMSSAGTNTRAPRILDLCCGQGRHALELARRYPRLEIYGHDQSEFLINLARDRAASAGVSDRCRFTVGDCRTIPFPADSFDLVMIMGNSFGYFTSTASDLQVLRECHRVARLGAYVVLDLTDGHYMKHNFSPRTWEWIDDDTFVCRERQLSKDGKSLVSREVVTEVSKGVIRDQFYAERLYELDELEMLMEMALFTPAREKHGRSNPPVGHSRSPTVPPGIPAASPSMSRSSSGLMHDSSAAPRGGSSSGVGGTGQGGMAGSINAAGGEVLTAAKDLSKRQEDLGMMEQRMLVIACKDKGRASDPAALVGFDAFSSEMAAAFAAINNEAAAAAGHQQQRQQQHQQQGHLQPHQTHHAVPHVQDHDDEILSETLGGTSGSSQFASDADDEFDSATSTHGGLSIDTARISAGTAFRAKMFSPVIDSGVSSGGSSSPSVVAEDTAVLTSCNGAAPESHVGTLLAHGKVTLHSTSSPVPPPNVRNLIVIMGDPRIPCLGKLNDTWNPEDLETRRKLVDVLEGAGVKWKKQDGTLKVVDKHTDMIESLVDVARNLAERKQQLAADTTNNKDKENKDSSPLTAMAMASASLGTGPGVDTLVFNLCDEGYWNDALQELHVPALLEMLQLPYTGATPQSLGLCYDKALVNAQARAMGIPTPREAYYLGSLSIQTPPHQLTPRGMDAMVREVDGLAYPAFVKPMRGDNSLGITPRSLVHSPEELHTYVCELHDAGLTDVVIQEYLGGQEFSVGVIGNPSTGFHFLPILQVDYSAIIERNLTPILGFESKWDPTSPYWNEIQYIRAELPARVEAALHARCAALFERFGCRDYARFDFRAALPVPGPMTETDDEFAARIKLLEVNPNPGWCWDGKLAHMSRLTGLSYQDMIMLILQAAVLRLQGSDGAGTRVGASAARD